MLGLVLMTSVPVLAQQTPSTNTEETQRRLRRTETRTTTTKLYPEKDTILVMLKNRMAVLNSGAGASTGLLGWFAEGAQITDTDGSAKTPEQFLASRGKVNYRNYRVRKLEITENTAQSVEEYAFSPEMGPGTTVSQFKDATIASQLRKDPDGRWRITEMRIVAK
ncbi:hypothetical protein GCM10027347_48850 [Larkinella harenae]